MAFPIQYERGKTAPEELGSNLELSEGLERLRRHSWGTILFLFDIQARMTRTFALFFFISATLSSFGQQGYRINGERRVKFGQDVYPQEFKTAPFSGISGFFNMLKSCTGGTENVYGNWFEYSEKSASATYVVHAGEKNGTISEPILMIAKEVSDRNGDRLELVECVDYSGVKKAEYTISYNEFNRDESFWLLVASRQKGMTYGLTVQEEFVPNPTPKEESKGPKHRISGRLSSTKTGKGMPDQKVRLLNESHEEISASVTNRLGEFHFEELPREEIYLTQIEAKDPDINVEVYLFDENGKPLRRAVEVADGIFGFPENDEEFSQLVLLTEQDWTLNVANGKIGITGRVVDAKTLLVGFPNVKVGIYDSGKQELESVLTDQDGRFTFRDREKKAYLIRYSQKPEDSYTEMVAVDDKNVPYLFATNEMLDDQGFFKFEELPREIVVLKRMQVEDVELEFKTDFSKMESGTPIVLNNIQFKSGSYQILESSYQELNDLAKALEEKPELKIAISGHTDNTGDEAKNLQLSKDRAKEVMNYLIEKGINKSRLTSSGFGSEKPIATNDTEEGRKKNRRVEFVVE